MVTLANIDLNNTVSNNNSNIDESKGKELQFILSTDSDGKANEENDSNTFMELASDEQIFKKADFLHGRLKE